MRHVVISGRYSVGVFYIQIPQLTYWQNITSDETETKINHAGAPVTIAASAGVAMWWCRWSSVKRSNSIAWAMALHGNPSISQAVTKAYWLPVVPKLTLFVKGNNAKRLNWWTFKYTIYCAQLTPIVRYSNGIDTRQLWSHIYTKDSIIWWFLKHNHCVLIKHIFTWGPLGLWVLSSPVSLCVFVGVSSLLVPMTTHHAFQLESPNLDNKCKCNILLKVPIVFEADWACPSRFNSNSIQNEVFISIAFASFKYVWDVQKRRLLNCSASHMVSHTYWILHMHANRVLPWTVK